MKTCSVEGCDRKHYAKGACKSHYQSRWLRLGSLELPARASRPKLSSCGEWDCPRRHVKGGYHRDDTASERYEILVVKSADGCYGWRGSLTEGYPTFSIGGQQFLAHRFIWEQHMGEIPFGWQVHHHCHTRVCSRIDHLEAMPAEDNWQEAVEWKKSLHCLGCRCDVAFMFLSEAEISSISKPPKMRGATVRERLEHYTVQTPGHWGWLGSTTEDGRARLNIGKQNRPVHRLWYEELVGPIPEGLELDHRCQTRWCVNPWHMEPVTPEENQRRAQHCGHCSCKYLTQAA